MALTVKEERVLRAVLAACDGSDSCLIAPEELLVRVAAQGREGGEKNAMTVSEMEKIVRLLELDDYFEALKTEKKGNAVYCFNLHTKGLGFEREKAQQRRSLYLWLARIGAGAVLSFILGIILKSIFKC